MSAISGLHILEMQSRETGTDSFFFGCFSECVEHMKLNEDRFECTIRPAHHDDVRDQIDRLMVSLARVNEDYRNSPWGMGASYRDHIAALEGRIRHFKTFLEPSPSTFPGEVPPAGDNAPSPPDLAGGNMTLAEAEGLVRRPDTEDATLLAACKVIDQHSRDPFYRDIAGRIIDHFEALVLEVKE